MNAVKSLMVRARALYARLSAEVRAAVADAATVAAAGATALSSFAAVLPAMHVPAADTAAVCSAAAALTGFVSWAVRKRLTKKAPAA